MIFPAPIEVTLVPISANVAAVIGWLTCAIGIAALCNHLFPWPRGCRDNPLIFSGIALLTLMPIGDHPGLAAGVHAFLGAPSATLMQLALLSFFHKPWPPLPGRRATLVLSGVLLVFYLLSLGAWQIHWFDPYAWGFLPDESVWLGLLTLAYLLYRQQQSGWLMILSLDILFWRTGFIASRNLWDALIDPLLLVILLYLTFRPEKQKPLSAPPNVG